MPCSVVGRGGNASNKILVMIDKALRGYFMMSRGNRMGSEEEFVNRLRNKLASDGTKKILAILRDVTIMSPNIKHYKLDAEELYGPFSSPEDGLSSDGSRFCVGTTVHKCYPNRVPSNYNKFRSC